MIEKYTRSPELKYLNILELFVLVCVDEYYNVLSRLNLFDDDRQMYDLRAIFWFFMKHIAVAVATLPIYVAIGVYLFTNLR